MNPCLVENDQMIFWYYILLVVQILQVCPLELSLKSRHPQGGCGRLQSWCAEKNGLLGQGFIFFCGGICGEKKTLLHFHFHCLFFESWGSTTFTWLATVPLGQKEVWRTMTIHHLTRKVRKYSTSRSILTANEWTQWRFFSSAMALALKKIASLCWCCVASAISIVFGAWLGSSLDQLGMSMLLQAFCVVASVLGHVLHCFPHHFLSESVLVPDGLLPLSPSLIRPKTWPPLRPFCRTQRWGGIRAGGGGVGIIDFEGNHVSRLVPFKFSWGRFWVLLSLKGMDKWHQAVWRWYLLYTEHKVYYNT